MSESTQVSRDPVGQAESTRAQRDWWDREAADYYTEHGAFLGDAGFIWGPEGWSEADLGLLGPGGVAPKGPVLEIGAGAVGRHRTMVRRATRPRSRSGVGREVRSGRSPRR